MKPVKSDTDADQTDEATTSGGPIAPHFASKVVLSLLREYHDRHFCFVMPGGNHGDYLIYLGMRLLAESVGIEYIELNYDDFMQYDPSPASVVYIHGSGGFVPWQPGTPQAALERAATLHHGPIIVGPSTVHLEQSYLKRLFACLRVRPTVQPIMFLAREMQSYEALTRAAPASITIMHDHDTALNVRKDDVLRAMGPQRSRRHYRLCAIRTDKERSRTDLSEACCFPVDPARYCKSFTQWLALHANATQMITNRLHSSILGSVLGVPTTLLPNSYHKNRAVWEYSLRDRGIVWRETLPRSTLAVVKTRMRFVDALLQRRSVRELIGRVRFGHLPS